MATDPKDKSAPTDIRTANVSRETLTGTPARAVHAEVASVSRETLAGSPARTVHAEVTSITRETLVKGPGVYSLEVSRETLVESPNEPTSVERLVTYAAQTAAGRRETLDPGSIHSWTRTAGVQALYTRHSDIPWARSEIDLATTIALVTGKAMHEWPRSPIQYRTAVFTAATERITPDPDDLRSPIRAHTYRAMAAISRTRSYNPVSAVYAKVHYNLVAAYRTAPVPISPLDARAHVSLVAQSRTAWIDTASAESASLAQLVAKLRIPVAPYSPPHVAGNVSLVATHRKTPQPFADTDAAQAVQQVVAARSPQTPISATDTAAHVSLVTARKDPDTPISATEVSQGITLAVTKRDVPQAQFSQLKVAQEVTLVTTYRKTDPPTGYHLASLKSLAATMRPDNAFPLSQAIVTQSLLHVANPKQVPAIEDVWSASPVAQTLTQTALARWTISPELVVDPTTGRHVQIIKVKYALGRNTPHPLDVYDPESGELARGVFTLISQYRKLALIVTRTVYGVTQSVLLRDNTFPPQSAISVDELTTHALLADSNLPSADEPASEVAVNELHAHAALVDPNLPSADTPMSDVAVDETFAQAALGDTEFPHADTPLSEAIVMGVHAEAAVGDVTFPHPDTPLSEAIVTGIHTDMALGDTTFPDANTPLSDVSVTSATQHLAIHDQDIIDTMPVSDTSVHNVVQAVVLSDSPMRRLPSRPAGARPVISIMIY